MTSMPNLYQRLLAVHGAAPVVTCYTDIGRVELSGRVLGNWVAKAASMLVEDVELEPGDVLIVDLPSTHWRVSYWVLAAWAVGASVRVAAPDAKGENASAVVTHRPDAWLPQREADRIVAVDLALLPRPMPGCLTLQEAGTISTHPDVLAEWVGPDPTGAVLMADGRELRWPDVLKVAGDWAARRVLLSGHTSAATALSVTAAAMAHTGSVVLSPLTDLPALEQIAQEENAQVLTSS